MNHLAQRLTPNHPGTLALSRLEDDLAKLQDMVASLNMAAAGEAITQMQAKQSCIREALSQGLQQLLDVHNGLNALTSLLERAEGQQLTCHDLACLIEPQQRKLMRGIEHAFQVL